MAHSSSTIHSITLPNGTNYEIHDTQAIHDDRLFVTLTPSGTSIPANADLNTTTYLKVGRYYCAQTANAKTLKNCPLSVAFMMEVYSPLSPTIDNESGTWVYRIRKMTSYNTGVVYMQYCSTGATAGVWTYGDWFVVPRSPFALDTTDQNGGSASLGSATQPIYMTTNGTLAACTYTLSKSVPSDAKFTDTTYSTMGAATASAAGSQGLVPAPAAGAQSKFLRGDGTWQSVPAGDITGVTAGNGLTGGGTSGGVTLAVGAGNGITVAADAISAKAGSGITVDSSGINHADTSSAANLTANGRQYVTGLTFDTYGHVTGYTTGTETVTSPTVNNGTLTIQKNGANVATFSANQSGNATANITVPTKVSELTNDSGFKTTDTTYTFATGSSNGTFSVTPSGGSAQSVSIKGLGSAAYTASTAYATAAQGTKADNALPKSGGNVSGHIYLTGANISSSTGSTSQLVFGTSTNNHVVLSSNNNALVLNPTTSTTTNQIVLYLDQASVFPSGIQANLTGTASQATADGNGNNIVNTYATKSELTSTKLVAVWG